MDGPARLIGADSKSLVTPFVAVDSIKKPGSKLLNYCHVTGIHQSQQFFNHECLCVKAYKSTIAYKVITALLLENQSSKNHYTPVIGPTIDKSYQYILSVLPQLFFI